MKKYNDRGITWREWEIQFINNPILFFGSGIALTAIWVAILVIQPLGLLFIIIGIVSFLATIILHLNLLVKAVISEIP